MKRAIITGITGQDGAYLAELLLQKGYRVYGTFRRSSLVDFWRIEELGIDRDSNLNLIEHDLADQKNAIKMVSEIMPDEIYNLAAQSFIGSSFEQPVATAHVTGLGPLYLLEAIRETNKNIKFYQASSSEMFGRAQQTPQNEKTQFHPRSPYGIAKLYAHLMVVNYQASYGIFAASGILFNHESPLRGEEFVTRKITNSVAKIKLGMLEYIELGNMDAKRDWGYAKEYVEGMHLMLQAKKADTFVLATNRVQTVRDFIVMAFKSAKIEIAFRGKGLDEVAIDRSTNRVVVKVNPKFYRPAETDLLMGDSTKAKKTLGWESKTTLEELCAMMVKEDLRRNEVGSKI